MAISHRLTPKHSCLMPTGLVRRRNWFTRLGDFQGLGWASGRVACERFGVCYPRLAVVRTSVPSVFAGSDDCCVAIFRLTPHRHLSRSLRKSLRPCWTCQSLTLFLKVVVGLQSWHLSEAGILLGDHRAAYCDPRRLLRQFAQT